MKDIDVQELKAKLDNKEDFILLDVRQPDEYEEYNIGAQLIPLGTLPARLFEFEDAKDKEIVVHCRSGARSANAKNFMISHGFTNVRNLLGGVIAWSQAFDK